MTFRIVTFLMTAAVMVAGMIIIRACSGTLDAQGREMGVGEFTMPGRTLPPAVRDNNAPATRAPVAHSKGATIHPDQLRLAAQKQYTGDCLPVTATPAGEQLRCMFQKIEGQATAEGLWLFSMRNLTTQQPKSK